MNLRELVLNMLLELEKSNGYSHILIRNVLDKYDYLSTQEKAFLKRVTEGTLERRIQLDYVIDQMSTVPVLKMKPLIRNLLRMSVYQILFMDGVPDSAVCNEAVRLAGKKKFQALKGFVNGVLRNISRNKENIRYPEEENTVEYLSVCYSMPPLLTNLWLHEYGKDKTRHMLQALLEVRPVTIKLREDLSAEMIKKMLFEMKEDGIVVKEHPYLPYAYELESVGGVKNIPGYEEGLFTVQDVSSMLCVEAAGIKKGDFIVDVCAAPGGKTAHAAQKLMGSGTVLARDISAEKIGYMEENFARQQLQGIQIQSLDAKILDEEIVEKADVVFADLPCSGLGVMGKKRDIKYHMTQEKLEELPQLQKEILSTVWKYIKPGGTLIYSTCTIHREENEDIVRWIREQLPLSSVDMSDSLPPEVCNETVKDGYLQLLPGIHKTDGFFIAKFIKK